MDPFWENIGPSGSIFENLLSPVFLRLGQINRIQFNIFISFFLIFGKISIILLSTVFYF